MDQIFAKIKGLRKNPFRKLISDYTLYEAILVNLDFCVSYSPTHNLDEDSWFKIEEFASKSFSIPLISGGIDSKEFDDLSKNHFSKISYIFSLQDENMYFQKISPSFFICKKTIAFGEVAVIEEGERRLVIGSQPDAVYFKASDTLIFRNLATISSIFKGIDILFKEATKEEVGEFLAKSFIVLGGGYSAESVSKLNRKRIALSLASLNAMSDQDRASMLFYINDYCEEKLKLNDAGAAFEISKDDELKLLLFGVEQRFYTTPFGKERRLANSVQSVGLPA